MASLAGSDSGPGSICEMSILRVFWGGLELEFRALGSLGLTAHLGHGLCGPWGPYGLRFLGFGVQGFRLCVGLDDFALRV